MARPKEISAGIQENPQGEYIVLARFRVAGPSLPPLEGGLARREKFRKEMEKRIAEAIASIEVV